jgi:xylulose-5-phosphate/fructose-6-phosphate phosphoketolase
VFDNPDLIVACVVGDGEAETGPLAASWHSNKFLNPARDGAVLPILHLNGYKIANPTVLGRMSDDELQSLFLGYGYEPLFVEGDDPPRCTRLMAATLDRVIRRIRAIQAEARATAPARRPPLADDRPAQPQGLDRPEGGRRPEDEGFWRAHQVPIAECAAIPAICNCSRLDASYRRKSCSTRAAACGRTRRRWRPTASAAWAPIRTPMAAC